MCEGLLNDIKTFSYKFLKIKKDLKIIQVNIIPTLLYNFDLRCIYNLKRVDVNPWAISKTAKKIKTPKQCQLTMFCCLDCLPCCYFIKFEHVSNQ